MLRWLPDAADAVPNSGSDATNVDAIFDAIDADGSGSIEAHELNARLQGMKLEALFSVIDSDSDGKIDRKEWRFSKYVDATFGAIDADDSGSIEDFELLLHLVSTGQDEETIGELFRKIDANQDGHISHDEWALGFGKYVRVLLTKQQRQAQLADGLERRAAEAAETAARDDFRALGALGGGCSIAAAEQRAISLAQLGVLKTHVERRCAAESWTDWRGNGLALAPASATLYDVAKHVVMPATVARRCSFVELLAREAQPPTWVVSHWWGSALLDLAACLEQHAEDYGAKDRHGIIEQKGGNVDASSGYWCCAFASNMWDLGEALSGDPAKTAFVRATELAAGTVAVLDRAGVAFSRVWCGYEMHVSLAGAARSKRGYRFVAYTALHGVARDESADYGLWRKGDAARAVGLARGFAPCDRENHGVKQACDRLMPTSSPPRAPQHCIAQPLADKHAPPSRQARERYFPLALAEQALGIALQRAETAVADDKACAADTRASQTRRRGPRRSWLPMLTGAPAERDARHARLRRAAAAAGQRELLRRAQRDAARALRRRRLSRGGAGRAVPCGRHAVQAARPRRAQEVELCVRALREGVRPARQH